MSGSRQRLHADAVIECLARCGPGTSDDIATATQLGISTVQVALRRLRADGVTEWRGKACNRSGVRVRLHALVGDKSHSTTVRMTPESARRMGLALLRWAAEQVVDDGHGSTL